MDFLKQLKRPLQAIQRAYKARQRAQAVSTIGHLMHATDPATIQDGVDYTLPVMLPGWLRDELTETNKLDQFITEAWQSGSATSGPYGQATRMQFDAPYKTDLPFAPVTDDPLCEWDWATRERVLTNTHAAYQRNPIAKRAVEYVANFVVGDGFRLTCKNTQVKAFIDDFMQSPDNQYRRYERQAISDLLVDGEIFLRFFNESGMTVSVPLRPWEVQYIRTEAGFFRRPQTYDIQRKVQEGDAPTGQTFEHEQISAAEVLHVAINNHAYELRGRPELYPVLPWLKAHKDWLENRARLNYWKSVLMWLVQVDAPNAQTMASVMARYSKPPTPGSIAVETSKTSVTPINAQVNAQDAGEDGRQLKLMTAVGFGLPEYFLSDGENANLASANKQELPALTTFGEFQRIMIEELHKPVLTRVLQSAVDAGLLPEFVPVEDEDGDAVPDSEPIATVDAFDIAYEPLNTFDVFSLAQALNIAKVNRWVSDKTASTEMGFDYQKEQKQINMEDEAAIRDVAQGRMNPMPGQRPDALNDPMMDEEPDALQPEPAR